MLSEVYDIECLSNLFTYTGYCRQDKTYYQFVIHQSKNEYKELIKHLFRDKLLMIGYNNENYDYPIIHHLINHYNEYIYLSGFELSQKIYEKSQEIIDSEFTMVADYNKKIIQIDLMRVHNYHNSARLTSLKSLEIALQLENVEDMPYEHFRWITKDSEIQEILNYNKNDVYATNEFLNVTLGDTEHSFYKGKNKIFLRQTIQKKYGVSGLSKDDVNLGVDLLFKLYCTKLGKSPKYVKSLKTPRPVIYVKDCIPKWADFKDTKLNKLLTFFKSAIVKDGVLKDVLTYSLIHHGIKIDYGAGGAHACIKPGIYKSDEEWVILDLDIDLTLGQLKSF